MTALHRVRRGAWHVKDWLHAAAIVPILIGLWPLRNTGGGMAGAIGWAGIVVLSTSLWWFPVGVTAYLVGFIFRTSALNDEMYGRGAKVTKAAGDAA